MAGWLSTEQRRRGRCHRLRPDLLLGAGVLFINYLCYQLGHPMYAICQAPGTTLADRYRALENSGSSGFGEFLSAEDTYLRGEAAYRPLIAFSLHQPSQRSIIPSSQEHARTRVPLGLRHHSHKVHVKPFFTCPAKDYSFQFVAYKDTVEVEVQVIGFAKPVFEWSVGGVSLVLLNGTSAATVDLDTPVPSNPAAPKRTWALLTFDYSTSEQYLTRQCRAHLR